MTFRKTKTVSPYFKLPTPHNPVTGAWSPLSPASPYCRFVLDDDQSLDTATEKAYGRITHQWGPGARHSYDERVAIYNLLVTEADEEAGTDAVYSCTVAAGESGFAVWDQGHRWVITGCAGGGGGNSVAVTTEIIPKRVGSKPGGPITVMKKKICDIEADPLEFCDNGTVEIYSWIKSDSSDPALEVDGELWIFIEQDEQGVWMFTGQDCPTTV